MPTTPLLEPRAYFARTDSLALPRAIGLAVLYWLGAVAASVPVRVADDFEEPVSVLYLLQTLEGTLLYWLVPTILLYGLALALSARERAPDPPDALALAAWGLVPLLFGHVVSNLVLYALVALEVDPAAVPGDAEFWLFVPLSVLACAWAASIWRGGIESGLGLERSTATTTALLAAGVCAALLVLPVVFQ